MKNAVYVDSKIKTETSVKECSYVLYLGFEPFWLNTFEQIFSFCDIRCPVCLIEDLGVLQNQYAMICFSNCTTTPFPT